MRAVLYLTCTVCCRDLKNAYVHLVQRQFLKFKFKKRPKKPKKSKITREASIDDELTNLTQGEESRHVVHKKGKLTGITIPQPVSLLENYLPKYCCLLTQFGFDSALSNQTVYSMKIGELCV